VPLDGAAEVGVVAIVVVVVVIVVVVVFGIGVGGAAAATGDVGGEDDVPVNTEPDAERPLDPERALDADSSPLAVGSETVAEVWVDDVVVFDAGGDAACPCGVLGAFRSAACIALAPTAPCRPLPPPPEVATRSAMSARETARITHQVGFPRALGAAAAAP
jgi:hypothetical protein